jgi:transposase
MGEGADTTIDENGVDAGKKDVLIVDSDEDTEDEENRLALQEREELKKRIAMNNKQIAADKALAVKVARKEKKQAARLKIEQQRADLMLAEKLQLHRLEMAPESRVLVQVH